jgi:lysine-N-methylase
MTEYVAAGYMGRFQCLGSSCEDTCCKAWDVPISEADRGRLAGALGAEAADQLVTRIPDGRDGTIVVLRKLPDRACPELDSAHLCSVHARFGEAALPDICASYPRVIGQLDDRLELTGHMSCPEVARLCLLSDDGALVPAEPGPFGRANARLTLTRAGAAPYLKAFETVRDAIVELVVGTGFPLASRLYFVAELATRLASFYHREAKTVDAGLLKRTIAAVRRPDIQAKLHAKRGASAPMEAVALQAVMGMIYLRGDAAPSFAQLLRDVADTYGEEVGSDPAELLLSLGPEVLWRTHTERCEDLGAARSELLDRYLTRYSRHYWLQSWFPRSATLFEHLMHLVLRVALVRFLFVNHPDVGPDADDAACDRAIVEVVYATARAYDHNSTLRVKLSETLVKRKMLTLEHCAALLKL